MKVKKFTPLRITVFILFSAYALTLILAWGWVLIQSLKDPDVYVTDKLSLPDPIYIKNYFDAFSSFYDPASKTNMFGMILNSLWYTFGSMALQIGSSVCVAYCVAKFKFPGRNLLYMTAIISMMIPIVGSMPSAYRIYDALGILDTPLIILRNLNAFGWNFIVIHGFMKNIPWSYAEAAYIDGCSHFGVFSRVMLPQVVSPITALCVMSFINLWNDYMTPLLYFPSYPTLVTGLYIYEDQMGRMMNYPTLFAGVIISVLPVVALFVAFQKQILEINVSGGLKG